MAANVNRRLCRPIKRKNRMLRTAYRSIQGKNRMLITAYRPTQRKNRMLITACRYLAMAYDKKINVINQAWIYAITIIVKHVYF